MNDADVRLRDAGTGDCDLLFDWINRPDARTTALADKGPIDRDTHIAWFAAKRADSTCRIAIIEHDRKPVGQVRLDDIDDRPAVSIYIIESARRHGIAQTAIRQALSDIDAQQAVARVLPDNLSSRRLFESLGFWIQDQRKDHIIYAWQQ